MKIAIIIPTYNEKRNIVRLINKILDLKLSDSIILVIDDNSPDGTGKAVKRILEKHESKIKLIERSRKLGLGTAYIRGFKEAQKLGCQIFITMDADFSHDPLVIPKLIEGLSEFDTIIGSRYVSGGKIVGFSFWRRALSKLAQVICKSILKLKIADTTSGFRCYKVDVLKSINPTNIKSEGYSFLIEAIYRISKKGFKVKEVPIIYRNRLKGESKISKMEIFKALSTVFRLSLY